MLLKRSWAQDIKVDDVWDAPYKLAKHHIYVYWPGSNIFPVDKTGFWIPDGFNSFQDKYQKSNNHKKVFCFGGSTTFGALGDYRASYPYYLEKFLKDTAVFNFGLGGMDITGTLYVFIDLLRLGFVPEVAIFLSGINEKQAWVQAINGYDQYEETFCQYAYFKDLVSFCKYFCQGKQKIISPWTYMWKFLTRPHVRNKDIKINNNPLRFVDDHAASHLQSVKTICKLAKAWQIDTKFFLQPILWDVWKEETKKENLARYEYIKSLYRSILAQSDNEIIDLSEKIPLKPEMFYDWQHLNSEGNKLLARSIYEEIKNKW